MTDTEERTMNETCQLCGGSFARFKGYVIVPTAWGIKHQHKPGDCRTGWAEPQTLAQKISDIH